LKKQLKFWVFIILLVLIAPVLSSCTTSQYKTYTLKHYGISFSFEYPSGYKKISEYLQSNPGASIGVRFALAAGEDPVFGVNIDSPLAEVKVDPKAAANTAGSHTPEQELERTSITVAGITGELVAYSSNDFQNTPSVSQEVFFSANGVLWNIYIYSATDKADEAKTDFEHIINTFKVLP
jgi:hypothetical protein